MGYSVFKFGALYLDDKAQLVPQKPIRNGDIPQYDENIISIKSGEQGNTITWIKPDGLNIFVADRVLLTNVSWENLNRNGFVAGKISLIDGQLFRCRLLQVGKDGRTSNEWDTVLDKTDLDNSLWHWQNIHFWEADVSPYRTSRCVVRGYVSARYWFYHNATHRNVDVGFRPALEPLLSDIPTPNINLEGMDFQLSTLPGGDTFYPILQPMQEDVFKDIPVGGKVRMYTFLEGGKPIHFGATVKDTSKLTLTDRYFGDDYLVPWVISNGVAVTIRSLKVKKERRSV